MKSQQSTISLSTLQHSSNSKWLYFGLFIIIYLSRASQASSSPARDLMWWRLLWLRIFCHLGFPRLLLFYRIDYTNDNVRGGGDDGDTTNYSWLCPWRVIDGSQRLIGGSFSTINKFTFIHSLLWFVCFVWFVELNQNTRCCCTYVYIQISGACFAICNGPFAFDDPVYYYVHVRRRRWTGRVVYTLI